MKTYLQKNYNSFEGFLSYSEMYGLHKRLGFETPEAAWRANPYIQVTTNPADYKVVSAPKPRLVLESGVTNRGARYGRPNILPANENQDIKLRMEKLRWVDGDYDQFGAYWGRTSGKNIFCAYSEEKVMWRSNWDSSIQSEVRRVEIFVAAPNRAEAKKEIRSILPKARFYN